MTATAKRPFPLLRPASMTDAEAIRDNDWSSFQHLTSVHDHWSLRPWAPGRTGYYWYLTFTEPALVDLVAQCQEKLAHDGLDPVPLDGLHLTLLDIGRTEEIGAEQLAHIIDAGRRAAAEIKPFQITVGPLTGAPSAVRFSVTPWDRLLDLHRRVRYATTENRPASRLAETADLRPHLGIGYINRSQHAQQLISDISTLRTLPSATAQVDKLHLVELRRVDRTYRWTDRAVIPLAN
ncbi:2'-5' RNA ligase family protein [Nocardia sp. NPDC050712]|uniref:2'-5' RNA ligase family protein n=1 Tax=Nocardia sp. NPDC050712 TaxID=3155518 RepID=UPI0033FFCC70